MQDFQNLQNPSKIAVVGVSQNQRKVSSVIFNQVKNSNFGGEVFAVNPKYTEIADSKCYPNLNSIDGDIDIAVIAIPAVAVLQVLEELEENKLKFAVIISGGFHQDSDESMLLKLVELSKQKNFRFIGPNSLGFIYPKNNLNLSFGPPIPPTGSVGLVSQSGAVLTVISDMANDYNLGLSQAYSIGDKADINEIELLELLIKDTETEVIGGYLEKIEDKDRFIEIVKNSNKPIIMLTPLESKAAQEFSEKHTGEDDKHFDISEIFNEAGVIIVESVEDLFFNLLTLQWCNKAEANRIGIISNTGGFAAVATDSISKNGFKLSELTEESSQKIETGFENSIEASNPIDILGDATSNEYAKALKILNQDENTNLILIILTPQSNTDVENIARKIVENKGEKPVICIFMGGSHVKEGIKILLENKVPTFRFLEHGLEAVKALRV